MLKKYQSIENSGSVKFNKLQVSGLIESFPHRLLFLWCFIQFNFLGFFISNVTIILFIFCRFSSSADTWICKLNLFSQSLQLQASVQANEFVLQEHWLVIHLGLIQSKWINLRIDSGAGSWSIQSMYRDPLLNIQRKPCGVSTSRLASNGYHVGLLHPD